MRWLLGLLKWVCEPFSDSFRIIELLAILIAFVAFFQDISNRQEEREARAWQLLTTKAPGNTGKVWALEYLNREQRWPRRWLWNKKRVPLHGIDLTPPDLAKQWRGKPKEERVLPASGCQQRTYLYEADLPNAELRAASLACSNLLGANLRAAILAEANFSGAELGGADLSKALLSDANFQGAELWGTNFREAYLRDANFQKANLRAAQLQKADLWGADLWGAYLRQTNFREADLRGTKGINCFQLSEAAYWQTAYRDEALACGAEIPEPPP